MISKKGIVLFTFILAVAVVTSVIVGAMVYVNLSHYKRNKHLEYYQDARYAYEAGLRRGYWEIAFNPDVYDPANRPYEVPSFYIGNIKVNVVIEDDLDGDGVLDINVTLSK